MADPSLYTYPSPLKGYEDLPTLPDEKNDSGPNAKSYINPPSATKSSAYTQFPSPITNGTRGGFDIHIYFQQTSESQTTYAKQLHERIRREFPELRVYSLFERPIGPHPIGMFEVNVFTPEQFGAFVSWLVVWRGPLSALVHPNTGEDLRDHSQRATWLGQPFPLDLGLLRELTSKA
ncbi:hypothetical protein WHR41_04862 [Cladosporium halotolerans]|uniref:DOPA 4,5-dioxygenase n=1 Tax=Cladosporium halotolerans TaxID=1052096 RepID=A0AB34KR25_9PEZI